MSVYLAKCRHNPSAGAGICELQPGVLVCPCLGGNKEPVAKLYVDDAGQLVWTALGANNEPRAYHTFVALRRGADGRTTQVRLAPMEKVPLQWQQGVGTFAVHALGEGAPSFVRVNELMKRSLDGEESVFLLGS